MQPRQGRDRRRDDDPALRPRPRRRLLRVDAVVPFQRGAGRLGGGGGVPGLNGVAAQVLCVRISCPTSAATAPPTPTTWASRCRMCSPHPSGRTTRTTRCGRCTATRAYPPTSSVSAARFGCVVQRRVRVDRGRGGDRPHPGYPGGRAGSAARRASRSSTPTPASPARSGVVGELVNIAGPGRFEGYYNDAAAEAQRMAGGVYHSGDLAYRDEAGYAYFAGRLGDWMRVDGENLGAAPIERVLLRYPDVTEVAVYAVPDPVVGDQVMAALVMAPGAEFDADKFRAFLAEQPDLGPKQWPSYVRVSAELPRTVTFKVLKRQLSAEGCRLRRSGVADPPVGAMRHQLGKRASSSFRDACRRPSASRSLAGTRALFVGTWSAGVAWSTIKVPLAIAALRSDRRRAARDLVVKAITESDNPASEELWSQLGDPADAARQVQAVIREAGDTATVVESRRLRRGFTAFGQTQWSLAGKRGSPRGCHRIADAATVDRPDAPPHRRPALGAGRQRLCRERRLGPGTARRLSGPAVRDRAHGIRACRCGVGGRSPRRRVRDRSRVAQHDGGLARRRTFRP